MRCTLTASYWTVAAITLERFVLLQFPLRAHRFSSQSINVKVVVGILISVLVFFSYYLLILGDHCQSSADSNPLWHAENVAYADQYIVGMVELVIPILLISTLNAAILVAMATLRARAGMRYIVCVCVCVFLCFCLFCLRK